MGGVTVAVAVVVEHAMGNSRVVTVIIGFVRSTVAGVRLSHTSRG